MRVHTYGYARVNGRQINNVSPVLVVSLVLAFFVLIGGIFAGVGYLVKRSDEKQRERCTVQVQAEVIDFKYNKDGLRTPLFSYEYEGTTYRYGSNSYSTNVSHYPGDKVYIMIDPDDPDTAYDPDDGTTAALGKIFMIAGFGVIGIGVIVLAVTMFIVHLGKKQAEENKYENWAQ